jgi:hypothetical protein
VVGPFHIGLGNFLLALLLAEFVLTPISTLIHELGHATIALKATPKGTRVTVVVGKKTAALGIVFERLTIWWSPIPASGVSFRGICIWQGHLASHRDRLKMALAGPLMTALLIPVYVAAAVVTRTSVTWIPATFGLAAFGCFASLLMNADPRTTKAELSSRVSIKRDGPQALAAYRAMKRS